MISLLLLCTLYFQQAPLSPAAQPTSLPAILTVEFIIQGMTCQVCQEHITWKINQLPGIQKVNVSYRKGNAIVVFDGAKTSITAITAAITAIDFKVVSHQVLARE